MGSVPSPSYPTLRPYAPADLPAVLALIDEDRLPGQPRATPELFAEATRGSAEADEPWWGAYEAPVVHVAVGSGGGIVGAVACARRTKDGAGLIPWLHCQEDPVVADALLSHASAALAGAEQVDAFPFATALTQGLEGLPVGRPPVTHAALERAGYAGERLWRYMRAELPRPGLPRTEGVRVAPARDRAGSQRLEVVRDGRAVAEAVIGHPVQGIGVLWWIEVDEEARGRGTGRALLGSALDALGELGATQVVLYVDDDETPGGERDRTAANRLYESAGFEEVDHLWSYTLSPGPPPLVAARTRS
ncbi:GNAT family N-acetyltransferase [Streptomyces sp. CAI-121]|uniref:GNAT family N-acetyltransferase n=1 Tax=unclassified Streptomyces TaxID=2593676 RepID=UPI0015878563|nr:MULTISPECIES: GNAT family N-acetyltransferase [unclassified Streptomyces]NUV68920.1 GNAT family N-acetyltransferase [Streptomyces sp. CAI-121]NUW15217.1 GNAT family N-acetyltransferase [Streptomyces sp. CAI-68]